MAGCKPFGTRQARHTGGLSDSVHNDEAMASFLSYRLFDLGGILFHNRFLNAAPIASSQQRRRTGKVIFVPGGSPRERLARYYTH